MYEDKVILFVDDDPDITNIYSSVFSRASFKYSIAHSGKQAQELIVTQKPYLLLLDVMLPDVSGLEILRQLKANPDTMAIEVWILSNLGDSETRAKAKELGASQYIVKAQFTPNQVVEQIKNYFDTGTYPSGT